MDIELIAEFSENQCYLNALSCQGKQPLNIRVRAADVDVAERCRLTETLEAVFEEPLGRLFLRVFLRETNSLEYLLCADEIDTIFSLPPSHFKIIRCRKLYRKFLAPGSAMELSLPEMNAQLVSSHLTLMLKRDEITPEEEKEQWKRFDGLLASLHRSIVRALQLSVLPSFLASHHYRRLLGFRMAEKNIMRDHFSFIRVLGEGGFGKVFAVSKRATNALYACKAIGKARVREKNRDKLILNERNVLVRVFHPFIVTLQYAFQDNHFLYLVLDLMSGGELRFHMARLGRFNETMVRFYAASIVLALDYFHKNGVVYRDLKPENVMLDADGFIRLTDLGLCSFIKPDERLHLHCGTRSYMAPEQCYGFQGYTDSVDWWSLGVLIYQLLTGRNPFSRRYRQRHYHKHQRGRSKPHAANLEKKPEASNPIPIARQNSFPLRAHDHVGASASVDYSPRKNVGGLRSVSIPHTSIPSLDLSAVHASPARSLRALTPLSIHRPPYFGAPSPRRAHTGVDLSPRIPSLVLEPPRLHDVQEDSSGSPRSMKRPTSLPAEVVPSKPPASPVKNQETLPERTVRYARLKALYKETVQNMQFPRYLSNDVTDLIRRLVCIDPEERLGAHGAEDVKAHPFFSSVDWTRLLRKHVNPPFRPRRTINAKFVQAAQTALVMRKGKPSENYFEGFDFVRETAFQQEVLEAIHDKQQVVFG